VGQKRTKENDPAELQTERVTAALEETDRTGRAPASVRDNPGQFLRDMYEVWHRQGGKEGAHWRNSIRKMRDTWLTGQNAVPSLHPKLMGRVKLTRSDVRALLDLFLGRWRYANGEASAGAVTKDGYVGFAANARKRLREIILDGIVKSSEHRDGFRLPIQTDERESLRETERRWVDIEKVVRECDALITLSRHKIAVGASPWQTIRSVWHMLNHLFEHDQSRGFPDRVNALVKVGRGDRLGGPAGERGAILDDLLVLKAEADRFGIDMVVDDEFGRLSDDDRARELMAVEAQRIRCLMWRYLICR
jgi:hypothetical protein